MFEVAMLRQFCVVICLAVIGFVPAVQAGQPSVSTELQLVNDSNDVIIQSQSKRQRQPGVRPQRYYCVIAPSGTRNAGSQASCPANPGRVGGRCRCANATGTGTLYTY